MTGILNQDVPQEDPEKASRPTRQLTENDGGKNRTNEALNDLYNKVFRLTEQTMENSLDVKEAYERIQATNTETKNTNEKTERLQREMARHEQTMFLVVIVLLIMVAGMLLDLWVAKQTSYIELLNRINDLEDPDTIQKPR